LEFADKAKREIEKALKDTLKNINLDEKERGDVEKELRSTYYEAAEAAARSRGADIVAPEDVRAAMADMGSPAETAKCIMRSHAGTITRVGFLPRLVAYIIDYFARGVVMYAVLFPMALLGTPFFNDWDIVFFNIKIFNFTGVHGRSPLDMAALIIIMVITVIVALAVFLCYNFILEGRYGFTIGKRIMGLRVLKVDGTKIGYQDAFIRNFTKYFEMFLAIDVLIMLMILRKEKQRGSDRIADTIVVRAGGQ
jgi:uncharacterized RDD family membrane protein YckC